MLDAKRLQAKQSIVLVRDTMFNVNITYSLISSPRELAALQSATHLTGKYLTAERLANSEFAITAEADGFIGGIIIAERPWGTIGSQWNKHVPNALEIGALFVDEKWRSTPAAFRLIQQAAKEAVRLRKTPVGVTESGSAVTSFLSRGGRGEQRREFTADGTTYIPWVLTGLARQS